MNESPRRQREVHYVLQHQNDAKTIILPVATYPRYVEAWQDGKALEGNGWHPVITRHSLPL